jgi:hypothetical protein
LFRWPIQLKDIIDKWEGKEEDRKLFPNYPSNVMNLNDAELTQLGLTPEAQAAIAYSVEPKDWKMDPEKSFTINTLDCTTGMPGGPDDAPRLKKATSVVTRLLRIALSVVMFFTPKHMRPAAGAEYMHGRVMVHAHVALLSIFIVCHCVSRCV